MKLLLPVPLAAVSLFAQTPSFEAASIKANISGEAYSRTRRATGRIAMENVSLRKMILLAYGIADDRDYALAGPGWLGAARFDVAATFPAGTTDEQARAMLRSMLAQRFHLALHREARSLPAYALVVAKGGPKLQPGAAANSRTDGRPGHLEASSVTMQKLADLFSRLTGIPVLDETGLHGTFTFTLDWAPDETIKMGPEAQPPGAASGPSIFSALQEQLGLKLERRKAPVEVLVVDHVERTPTEN